MPRLHAALVAGAGAVLYCGAVTWYLLTHGGWPTPDFLIPPLLLLALVAGRGRTFLLDWTPFLVLLLAWEATRGIADRLGMPVQIETLARMEESLFFGHIPTLVLQERLYDPERGSRWFDWIGAVLHSLHFALPIAFGFILWLRDRALYWRYVISVLALFLLAFAGYVLVPAAPPWLAAGYIHGWPYVSRIGVGTILSLPVQGQVTFVYDHIRPNDVAAMPSLHAALPLLLSLILWQIKRSLAYAGFLYTATLAFFLVYHGEHYVVDILAGWVLAALVYWFVWTTPAWLRRRLPSPTTLRRRAVAIPATALAALVLIAGTAAALRPNAFGSEPTALLPLPPTPTPIPEERHVLTGPCGVSGTLTGVADALLAPVAQTYAAYLIDPELGLCLTLSRDQPIPPPGPAERQMIAAQAGTLEAPNAGRGEETGSMQISVLGTPSEEVLASGVPPGRYLLLVLLYDVPDAGAARGAAVAIAAYVFSDASAP